MYCRIALRDELKKLSGHVAVVLLLLVTYLLSGCGDPGDGEVTVGTAIQEPDTPSSVSTVAMTPDEREPIEPVAPAAVTGPVSYEEAERAYRARRFEDAVHLFSAYTEEKTENPWGYYMLGLSARKAGDFETAELAFGRALELDSGHVKSYLNLSRVLIDTQRPEEALERIQLALSIDSVARGGQRLLGRAFAELGRVEEAIEAYQKAITIDDGDVWAMNNLGLLYITEGRSDEALLPLARAVEIKGDVAVFQNNLGMALERTGHFTAGADAYRAAVDADPSHDKAASNLARVEGRADADWAPPIELAVLAQEFVDQIETWRQSTTEVARQPESEIF
jgi:Flp pilus assembly protein TadD